MQVLIVDDDFITRRLLRARLEQTGFDVYEANHGQEAWDILQEQAISLVITDWLMPVMDGPQLIELIRNEILDRYVYITLLTSLDNPQDVVQGLEVGADDYLVKPFNMLELQARIGIGKRIIQLEQRLRHLNSQLYEQATYDPLTHLFNRSTLLKRLEQHLHHSLLLDKPICLALCDIDHFKNVNDTYGHAYGDEVLIWLADLLPTSLRASDDVGRWGGEEFLIVLPGATSEYAQVALQRLLNLVERTSCMLSDGTHISVTLSIGAVSSYITNHTMMQTLLKQADIALYQSKRAGRNQLTTYEALITNDDNVRLPQEL